MSPDPDGGLRLHRSAWIVELSQPTNHAYVTNRFESKSEEFIEQGGDPGSRGALRLYVRAHEDLLHACALPVLCHNDFHARNVLASKGSGTLRLSGILDFEGAQAADPLMDLAKTLYCCPDVDDAKRAALLDGYGEPARKNWRKTVELYYLYYILEFWCWMALLGNAEPCLDWRPRWRGIQRPEIACCRRRGLQAASMVVVAARRRTWAAWGGGFELGNMRLTIQAIGGIPRVEPGDDLAAC